VNEIEHHLIWEAMGPMLKKDSLGMMTNKLAEGPPPQSSQGYVDAKLYAARMRWALLRSSWVVVVIKMRLPVGNLARTFWVISIGALP